MLRFGFVPPITKCLLAVAVLAIAVGAARAEDVAGAKAHHLKGQSHYAVGEFADAAREYREAYKLKADPALLCNAAQAARLAGLPVGHAV
jgi:hypothetical protein